MVKKILVEGLDYAGKTTLAKGLVHIFNNMGLPSIYNKGNMVKTSLDDYVRKELYSESSDLIRLNALLTLGPLIDALENDSSSDLGYLVQESYIDRTIAYNKANKIPYFAEILEDLQTKLVQFDVSLFLDADIETRQKRYYSRTSERNKFDELIFADSDLFCRINDLTRELVLKRTNSHLIDTSNITEEEVRQIAINLILGN